MSLAEDAVIAEYQHHGFQRVVVRRDEPNFSYPIHYHAYNLVLQVMEGELTVIVNHRPTTCAAGQHVYIAAECMHEVQIGSKGCTYIHAERTSKRHE